MKNSQKGFVVPLLLALLAILVIGGGYIYVKKINSKATTTNNVIVGNDRDAHGCIPSAGYSWCEAKNKCFRPWEEKCETTSTVSTATTSISTTTACTSDKGKVMTYAKALEFAKTSSCAKIGKFTGEYNCNQNAGGLVDVYMKPTNSPNCGFACRISIDTGKAEEGWMCTMGAK